MNQAFGVTVTDNYVVYTDVASNVYAKKMGDTAPPVVMTSSVQTGRGVVWDGDGTIYVADSQ